MLLDFKNSFGNPLEAFPVKPSSTPVPLTIDGCSLWLRADLGLTIVSGHVSAWEDQSSGEHDVAQTTAGNRPAHTYSGIGGLQSLTFGADDYMSFTPWEQGNTWSAFFVSSNSDTSGYAFIMQRSLGTGTAVWISYYDGAPGIGYYALWGSSVTDPCIVYVTVNCSTPTASSSVNDGTPVSGAVSPMTASNWTAIGDVGGTSLVGNLSEIVMFDSILSEGDEDKMWRYLSGRYSISLA